MRTKALIKAGNQNTKWKKNQKLTQISIKKWDWNKNPVN